MPEIKRGQRDGQATWLFAEHGAARTENLFVRFILIGDRTVTSLALRRAFYTDRLSVCTQRPHSLPHLGPHTTLGPNADRILSVAILSGERSFDLG